MSRHSEFNACNELATDARQRAELMRRDAAARAAMARATTTKRDRRRIAATRRAHVIGALVGAGFLLVTVYTFAGFIIGGGA